MTRPLCLALALILPALPALATTQDDVLDASVLTGWQEPDGHHMAALKLTLAPGWKTYWRAPGDAGIPPQFDWSGSENLKSVELHWPAPSVFDTSGLRTLGYHDELVLPVEVVAKDPSKPVTLSATVEMGICRDICLPATVMLSAVIAPPGAADPAIRAALAAQPVSGAKAGLTAIACTLDPIKDGLRLTATLALPPQGGEEVVAFETSDPRIWVSEATTARKGNTLTAVAEMVPPSGKPFALDRSAVTVTVISAKGAVEIAGYPAL